MNFAGPWVIPIPSFRTPERLLNKVHCLAATFPRASTQWGRRFCGLEGLELRKLVGLSQAMGAPWGPKGG